MSRKNRKNIAVRTSSEKAWFHVDRATADQMVSDGVALILNHAPFELQLIAHGGDPAASLKMGPPVVLAAAGNSKPMSEIVKSWNRRRSYASFIFGRGATDDVERVSNN